MAIIIDNTKEQDLYNDESMEHIPLKYWPRFLWFPNVYLKKILEIPFRRVLYTNRFGKECKTPRFTYCYGRYDDTNTVTYKGVEFEVEDMPPWLDVLKNRVSTLVGMPFNSVLLNKYYPEDSINFHPDDEKFLQHNTVAGITLGTERPFRVKKGNCSYKSNGENSDESQTYEIWLKSGSLVIINGSLLHSLPVRKSVSGVRYNITFRMVNSNKGIGNYYYYNRGYSYLPSPSI